MKVIKQLVLGGCLLIAFASCGGDDKGGSSGVPSTPTSTAVTGVSINKTTLTIVEGGSETVTATVSPSTAINKNVSWSSSDDNIASVDNEGKITAKKPGTVTITVTTADGNKTATLTLTVDLDYIVRQKAILKKLYDSLGGSSWTNKTGWNTEAELKDWYGISMTGNKITAINLKSNNLKGKIPASLGETLAVTRALSEADTRANDDEATTRATESVSVLGGLKELDMSGNQISGSIPPEIGNLNTLTNLNLGDNNISGSIPSELGNLSNLTNLDLGNNNISGAIPAEVGNLTNLTNLDLGGNDLTGSIPDELGNLSKLENLNISDNKLSGEISTELQESDMWKNLKEEPELKQQSGAELEKEVEITTPVTGVTLDKTTLDLTIGETATLTATVAPANASKKTVSWSSSDTNVATIDNGVVKAISAGTATITVTTKDGNKTATCTVTVKEPKIAVTGVSLNKTSLELTVGDIETLTATVTPSDATDKSVTWSSDKTSVATVDANGKVTAVAAGNAIITVTTKDGSKTATCSVTVKASTIAVTSVEFPKSDTDIQIGSTLFAGSIVTVKPDNATDKSLSWSSSDTTIATVNSDGDIKGIAIGTTTITATSNSDPTKKVSFLLTVRPPRVAVTNVTLNKTSLELMQGDTYTLTATVAPTDATNKAVTWATSDAAVASVSTSGVVTATGSGSATITVTTTDGSFKATCTVAVTAASTVDMENFENKDYEW